MRSNWTFLLWCASSFAIPQDPIIVSGEGSMSYLSPEVFEIIAQDGTMIEWGDFSIRAFETTRFSQPSADSLVVNRVVGLEMSQILGKLEANGRVLLINPNGIFFGKGSRIDTGSFIASTLDLQNNLFAKSKTFQGSSAAQIINHGSINVFESLALIASDIDNQGSLNAQNGTVALIGSTYRQDFECLFPKANGSRITHSGRIDSPGGRIQLMADEIYVFSTSEITSSSRFNGGEIFVGGGPRGKDPSFSNAQVIWVEERARFSADAWEQGNGGMAIFYSDQMTDFSGLVSAQGGKWMGNGGFVEVSGGYLGFKGLADLRSPLEKAGVLLLDPSDITITAAVDAGNTVLLPIVFPLNCGSAAVMGGVISQNLPAGAAASISIMPTLMTQIGLGHIIIDSTGAGAGTGNIIWSAGADFAYISANDLVLRAPVTGTVTILSNVQNSGTGRTIIDSQGPRVEINTLANNQKVSFGSALGLTQICAPSAVVELQGGILGAFGTPAQVGFYTPTGAVTTATGPISIDCLDLNIFPSPRNLGGAQVGHGQIDAGALGVDTNTTAAATITVNAARDITMTLQANGDSSAAIGHGSRFVIPGPSFAGDINVQAGRDILMQGTPTAVTEFCVIGNFGGAGGGAISIFGQVCVAAARNITMLWNGGAGTQLYIGNGTEVAVLTSLAGNIDVCCGNDLILTDLTGAARIDIGHVCRSGPGTGYTGTTRVTVGRDLLATGLGAMGGSRIGIGIRINPFPLMAQPIINFTAQVTCGRDLLVNVRNPFVLGIRLLPGTNINPASNATTLILAGNDIAFNATGQVTAYGNLAIAAGGNFSATPTLGNLFVTSQNRPSPGLFTTNIYARGNIIGTNSAAFSLDLGNAFALNVTSPFPSVPNYFVDFRAGGDIQIPFPLTFVGTGDVFIEADTIFTPGQQWTSAGGVFTSICGFPCVPPSCCAGSALATSPSLNPNGIGSVSATQQPLSPLPVLIDTTSGNITIHSGPVSALSAASTDIRIGANLGDDLTLTTISGNIDVSGSFCGNAFNNITLNQPIVTTGTVLIVANNNLTMTSLSSISTTSQTTLVCDNQFPFQPLIGQGFFDMDGASFINTGGAPLCIHTARQGFNNIQGSLNGNSFTPSSEIFVDSAQEVWCYYFCSNSSGGCTPFTVTYKDGCPIVPIEVGPITAEFFVDLHPYDEYPGWMMRFWITYPTQVDEMFTTLDSYPYLLQRRLLKALNHPKSWTRLIEESHTDPIER